MSEEAKMIEQIEQEAKASELSEQEQTPSSGGASNAVIGIDIYCREQAK